MAITQQQYEAATDHIRTELKKIQAVYNKYAAEHKDALALYMQLMDKYRNIPKDADGSFTERNRMMTWLQESNETGLPAGFALKMTEIINQLDFYRHASLEWQCDDEAVERREGKTPHSLLMIDDRLEGNPLHDASFDGKKSVLFNPVASSGGRLVA